MTTKIVTNLIESIIENDDEEAIKDVVRLVNEDEFSPTSQKDLIYKMQIEQEEVGEEEEEERVIYIEEEEEEQNEIEQEVIFIDEGHEKKEQVK
ncbi:hypothetical protein RHMOL_Rhmol05G0244000 [Rhododendron molle]|uniref:Uncharacterized protein n=1 Tax=Rhododendron molle TaxID=49168 RepID=A0ACC0NSG6_RHOML|nr:hypothetical protein RHMOL_Rhmol05G0244000 [Rhododendron molle]